MTSPELAAAAFSLLPELPIASEGFDRPPSELAPAFRACSLSPSELPAVSRLQSLLSLSGLALAFQSFLPRSELLAVLRACSRLFRACFCLQRLLSPSELPCSEFPAVSRASRYLRSLSTSFISPSSLPPCLHAPPDLHLHLHLHLRLDIYTHPPDLCASTAHVTDLHTSTIKREGRRSLGTVVEGRR